MKNSSPILILLACFLVGIALGNRWGTTYYQASTQAHTVTDTTRVTHIDTVRIAVHDTIRIRVPLPVAVPLPDDPGVNTYSQSITDTLIDGRMHARVRGELLDWGLDYRPLFPLYITRTDTVFIERHTTVTERLTPHNPSVLTGGIWGGGARHSSHIGPSVGWIDRSHRHWSYRYDLVTGGHHVGVSFPIFSR